MLPSSFHLRPIAIITKNLLLIVLRKFYAVYLSYNNDMLISQLFKDIRFKRLVATLLLIIPFEFLSLLSIHLPRYIELPLFTAIIVIFGRDVIVSGLKSLIRFDFSDMNLLMTVATACVLPRRTRGSGHYHYFICSRQRT